MIIKDMGIRFASCGPNEAMVAYGCCYRKPRLIAGGVVFICSPFQSIQKISLNIMTLIVDSTKVYTSQGVPISVTGIAQIKIQGQNHEMLANACELFLGKTNSQIRQIALATLEGHQRAIMGRLTVEEIYKDRKKFSHQVFEVASSDLVNMGITVVSYTIKDIQDDEGYLEALGMSRTAQVKRDARIGEAEARADATIKVAYAEEKKMESVYANEIKVAEAERDFELKKAAYDIEVKTKEAETDLAYELQATKIQQRIKEENMQIEVIDRMQQIEIQKQEEIRKERELKAAVLCEADAEKYRMEKLAEAHRKEKILEAEAEAEAIRLRGEAEAYAIQIKAKAEAEQMEKKAEAWNEYKEAAMVKMVLDVLPQVAAEVAAPLAEAKKITMVSTGSGDIGVSKLTSEIMNIIMMLPKVVAALSGADLDRLFKQN
ncbi:flotillin-1-like [Coccinella septempunctata]|uniref:flotillin-1-like n=1 Tax=Coccinella septempunctata TaxID=41139 RepID=UPI001D0706E5|nr:flotillin-1-like [Coccinella septempunctata]